MYFVKIDNVTDEQLAFCGFHLVHEDDAVKIYEDKHRDAHIVDKNGVRFLKVDDPNDAVALGQQIDIIKFN